MPSPAASEGHVRLPLPADSKANQEVMATALLSARVEGDASTGCVWLVSDAGGQVTAVWPSGYTATFDPLVIYDATGKEVLRAGELHDFGGGVRHIGETHATIDPACVRGDSIWFAAP